MAKQTTKKKASAKAEKTAAPEAAPTTAPAPEAAPVEDGSQITIADLQAIAGVIDAAVRRGAFGASEVGEVSAIYLKLENFLKVIAAQQQAAEAQQGGQ